MLTTHKPYSPISTLALAYANGSRYMAGNQLFASYPKGFKPSEVYPIASDGRLLTPLIAPDDSKPRRA